ncbi:hypothetical protein HHL21_14440 [Massilia sp. RP-1-19]|uniref:Uncharacterized protein n=1 Tax=Massilia polaris TaxID=2728846 RepID=A0A848HM22_9BURK|nr:hypothetical protein [Massilia polaris]NML62252.1 hypothetical protein [Massilia polaris]
MDTTQSSSDTASELAAQVGTLAEGDIVMPPAVAEVIRRSGGAEPVARSTAVAPGEEWRIGILGGGSFTFSRYINGAPNEVYRTVDLATAAVWSSAVIQGFQPPRYLLDSDKPAG